MTTTCQPALQQAVYAQLTGDTQLMALISGVFDEVTTAARMPYVVLADVHEVTSEAHDRVGIDASMLIDVWSVYRGYTEVATIAANVDRLLHRQTLTVAGFTHVSIANETHQFMRDPDPDLRRCSTRYRIWLEATGG